MGFFAVEDDLTLLGNSTYVEVDDFTEWLPRCFLFNLEDLLCHGSICPESWKTSLFVDELMMLCN
jgi:hypothetical protein